MSLSDARAALEGNTPPPAPRLSRDKPDLGESVGAVTGVRSDQVYVTVVTDRDGDARVCLVTSWDADAEVAATVALDASGVEALVDMLSAYRPYVGNVCAEHLLVDCEDCELELGDPDQ
jgi:hypothetical protein